MAPDRFRSVANEWPCSSPENQPLAGKSDVHWFEQFEGFTSRMHEYESHDSSGLVPYRIITVVIQRFTSQLESLLDGHARFVSIRASSVDTLVTIMSRFCTKSMQALSPDVHVTSTLHEKSEHIFTKCICKRRLICQTYKVKQTTVVCSLVAMGSPTLHSCTSGVTLATE
jgi:hypothetical protein